MNNGNFLAPIFPRILKCILCNSLRILLGYYLHAFHNATYTLKSSKTVKSCPCNKTTQYLHYISFMNNGNFLTVVLHCIFKCKSSNPFRIRSSNHFHGLYYSFSTLKTLYLPESHYYDNNSTFGNFSQKCLLSHNLNHQQNNYIT